MGAIIDWISEAMLAVFNVIMWYPCNWVLQLLDAIHGAVKFLATDLLETILFGTKVNDWSQVLIPSVYYKLLIVAGVCYLVIFAINFLCILYKDSMEGEEISITKKVWISLKYTSFSTILIILMPLMIWMLLKLTTILTEGLTIAFGAKNTNISDLLYNLGNPNWDGNVVEMKGKYPMPRDIADWNLVVQLVGLCIIFIALLLVMINIVVNIFATYFYFIMTGFFALAASFDEGRRTKDYAKTMIANNLVICSTMVIFSVFTSLLSVSFGALSLLNSGVFVKMLIMLALAAGGGMFVVNGSQYVSRIVGENISGTSEAMSGLGLLKAGAGMATGLGILSSKLFHRSKKDKKSQGRGLGGEEDAGIGEEDSLLSDEEENQNAKENFIQGKQKAKQRAKQSSLFSVSGAVGAATGLAFGVGKFVKNAKGFISGSKADRLMARERLKEQFNVKGMTKKGLGKVVGVAGVTVGALGVSMGIGKILTRNANQKAKAYEKNNGKERFEFAKKEYNAHNEKLDKKFKKRQLKYSVRNEKVKNGPVRKFFHQRKNKKYYNKKFQLKRDMEKDKQFLTEKTKTGQTKYDIKVEKNFSSTEKGQKIAKQEQNAFTKAKQQYKNKELQKITNQKLYEIEENEKNKSKKNN